MYNIFLYYTNLYKFYQKSTPEFSTAARIFFRLRRNPSSFGVFAPPPFQNV
jgi:hypothetical protein